MTRFRWPLSCLKLSPDCPIDKRVESLKTPALTASLVEPFIDPFAVLESYEIAALLSVV